MIPTFAAGYTIEEYGNVLSLIPLVFESIGLNVEECKGDEKRDLENLEDFNDLIDFLEGSNIEYKLYPDIVWEGDSYLMYRNDRDIKIGDPTSCAQMIYILENGENTWGPYQTEVSDNTVLNLVRWKQQLVKQGRLKETKLCLAS
jgi:hypothetical protein